MVTKNDIENFALKIYGADVPKTTLEVWINEFWSEVDKSIPMQAVVKPDACVKALINELKDMLSVLSGIDPLLDRYATIKMLENRIKELEDIGNNQLNK